MNLPLVYKTYGRSLFIKLLLLAATLLLIPMLSDLAHAQARENVRYVSEFQGADVGTKITAAQNACVTDATVPCVIVIDTILSVFPQGTMPARCSRCTWVDWRTPGEVRWGFGNTSKLTFRPTLDLTQQNVDIASSASSIGSTTLFDSAGFGSAFVFRVSYYLVTATAGTAGTATVTIGWQDNNTGVIESLTSPTIALNTLGSVQSGTFVISGASTYSTTVSGLTGPGSYALRLRIEVI